MVARSAPSRRPALRLLVALAAFAVASPLAAQPTPLGPPLQIWAPDGEVMSLALDGHTLFVGGAFRRVGPVTGPFAVVGAADDAAVAATALAGPSVRSVLADGSGGWFVAVLGSASPDEPKILHLLADGSRDPAWTSPAFGQSGAVALALDGPRLFAAGGFVDVNGVRRPGVIALDRTTGALLPWDAQIGHDQFPNPPPYISAIAASQGRVYITGPFRQAGGANRSGFAVLDATTAAALPPQLVPPSAQSFVSAIATTQDRVYLQDGCGPRDGVLCAFTLDLAPLPGWAFPTATFPITASSSGLFAVDRTSGTDVRVLKFDASSGLAAPWTPPQVARFDNIGSLAVADGRLYLGGTFRAVSGVPRTNMAAVDAESGALQPWAPLVGGLVSSIAVQGSRVAFGGDFRGVGGVRRENLVALDLRTGRPAFETPDQPFAVAALHKIGDVMVVGGSQIGVPGGPIASAFSASTGLPYPWTLTGSGAITALASDTRFLYLGGVFTSLAGMSRRGLASIDLQTIALSPWNPAPDGIVTSIEATGSTTYVSGGFGTIAGTARPRAAAFGVNGDLLPFSPGPGSISATATYGDRVLLIGRRGSGHDAFEWVDASTGASVEPVSDAPFTASFAARVGTTIAAGGVAGLGSREKAIAFVDAPTGAVQTWTVDGPTSLRTMAVSDRYLVLGGRVYSVNGSPVSNLAVFGTPSPTNPPRRMTASASGARVTLGWSPGPPPVASAYVVEAGTTFGGTEIGRFPVNAATGVSGVLPPGTYYARVRGVGLAGESVPSSEVIFSLPTASTPPEAPTSLSHTVNGSVVTLSWTAAAGNATSYVLEAGTAPGLTNLGAFDTTHLDTTFTASVPSGTYYVRVRARNAFGGGSPSNEVAFVVP